MDVPRRKPNRRYLLYRVFVIVAVGIWNIGVITALIFSIRGNNFAMLAVPAMFPIIFPAIFILCNLGAIPLPYSVFGPYERTAFPREQAAQVISHSWGRFGRMSATWPMVTWHIFPSGLGVSIERIGDFFIPWHAITAIEPGFLGKWTISHTWPEARTPIVAPNAVGLAISSLSRCGRRKQL